MGEKLRFHGRCKLFSACLTPESFLSAVSRCCLCLQFISDHFVHDHRPLYIYAFPLSPLPHSMGSCISISNQSYRTSGGGQCQAEIKRPKRFYTPLAWSWSWPLVATETELVRLVYASLPPQDLPSLCSTPRNLGCGHGMGWERRDFAG